MKNEKLFNKTVGILVRAYMYGTLVNIDCAACAVGNLVCANMGYTLAGNNLFKDKNGRTKSPKWHLFKWAHDASVDTSEAEIEIVSTGYSVVDFLKIERSFMTGHARSKEGEDPNFSGLMSVIDTLMLIHEATTEEADLAKELFVTNTI